MTRGAEANAASIGTGAQGPSRLIAGAKGARSMPNKPRPENPARPVRVEDELWARAKAKARNEGTTVSEVIREALRQYVSD